MNIYKKLIKKNGFDNQLGIVQEECSELIKAISKYNRGGGVDRIIEEAADVQFMLNQIKEELDGVDEQVEILEKRWGRKINFSFQEKCWQIFCRHNSMDRCTHEGGSIDPEGKCDNFKKYKWDFSILGDE